MTREEQLRNRELKKDYRRKYVNGIKNIKFIIHMNFYINLKVIFYTLVCRL